MNNILPGVSLVVPHPDIMTGAPAYPVHLSVFSGNEIGPTISVFVL